MNNETKRYLLVGVVIAVIFGGIYFFKSGDNAISDSDSKNNPITAVRKFSHGHGLSVDIDDPSKVYIATHEGLLVMQNDKDLYRIGNSQDDYMGFSPHPNQAEVFFTSGHPKRGGNLGVQKSEDGGETWEKISSGVGGPVDFHTMDVSPVNPDIMYGWYGGSLQRSVDGGKSWKIVQSDIAGILSLTADTEDENKVYAATSQGIKVSKDKGDSWEELSEDLKDDTVTVIGVEPKDSEHMLAYSMTQGMIKSLDGGNNWKSIDHSFGRDPVLHIAFQGQNPDNVYTLTKSSAIYKSSDKGSSWTKVY